MNPISLIDLDTHFEANPPRAFYHLGVGNGEEWHGLQKRFPGIQLFGCEPWYVTYLKLIGRYPGILLPVAVASSLHGRGGLYQTKAVSAKGSMTLIQDGQRRSQAQIWSLDEFDRYCGEQIGIWLWADIEGSELSSLRSGPRLLESGRIDWITLEVQKESPRPGWPCEKDIVDFLGSWGFRVFARDGSDLYFERMPR